MPQHWPEFERGERSNRCYSNVLQDSDIYCVLKFLPDILLLARLNLQ